MGVPLNLPLNLDHKKVLIIRLSALGDVIRTIPSVMGLMKRFPNAQFHWLVENSSGALVREIPGLKPMEIDRASLRSANPLKVGGTLLRTVRRIRAEAFDVSIDYHGVAKSGMFALFAGIPLRIGYERGGSKEGHRWLINHRYTMPDIAVSRYERNLAIARFIDPAVDPATPKFEPGPEQRAHIETVMAEQPILLFPGTSTHGRNKRWPAQNWAWLFRNLSARSPVRFVFGPADKEYRERLHHVLGESVPVLPPMSLLELCYALRRSRFLISCDTGPMHLASVMGVPLVAMLGPSDPVLNQPLSGKCKVLLPEVPCAPCRNRSCTVLICQDATTPKRVLEAALTLLDELEPGRAF